MGGFKKDYAAVANDPFMVTAPQKKALLRQLKGLFYVSEPDEIPNLDLIKDIDRIIKLYKVLSLIE